jgi:hypothetical protein
MCAGALKVRVTTSSRSDLRSTVVAPAGLASFFWPSIAADTPSSLGRHPFDHAKAKLGTNSALIHRDIIMRDGEVQLDTTASGTSSDAQLQPCDPHMRDLRR